MIRWLPPSSTFKKRVLVGSMCCKQLSLRETDACPSASARKIVLSYIVLRVFTLLPSLNGLLSHFRVVSSRSVDGTSFSISARSSLIRRSFPMDRLAVAGSCGTFLLIFYDNSRVVVLICADHFARLHVFSSYIPQNMRLRAERYELAFPRRFFGPRTVSRFSSLWLNEARPILVAGPHA